MIDWIKSWFGKGKVRVEFKGIDRTGKIVTGDAKAPYVGHWNEDAMLKYVANELLYQHGVVVTQSKIVAHIEE